MGRRKKEPRTIHRENISTIAQSLFLQKGIAATTMNDIAKEAGYSKATLYVYFQNKDEIISHLVLHSMETLYEYLCQACERPTTKECYNAITQSLVQYQEAFPFYFKIVVDHINIDFTTKQEVYEDQETYLVGEKINQKLNQFLTKGIAKGDIRKDIDCMATIFCFWGMLSGLIEISCQKAPYIQQALHMKKDHFLAYGFDTLYRSIQNEQESL